MVKVKGLKTSRKRRRGGRKWVRETSPSPIDESMQGSIVNSLSGARRK